MGLMRQIGRMPVEIKRHWAYRSHQSYKSILDSERAFQEFRAFRPGMVARPNAGRFGVIGLMAKISQRLHPRDAGGTWNLRAPRADIEALQGRQRRG